MNYHEFVNTLLTLMPNMNVVRNPETDELVIETGSVLDRETMTVFSTLGWMDNNESFEQTVATHCNFDPSCNDANCLCEEDKIAMYNAMQEMDNPCACETCLMEGMA